MTQKSTKNVDFRWRLHMTIKKKINSDEKFRN